MNYGRDNEETMESQWGDDGEVKERKRGGYNAFKISENSSSRAVSTLEFFYVIC